MNQRHIVCLTFDFDAVSGWIAKGYTTPTPISRGEFGAIGAKRILELLARYNIPATWFIPGVTIGTYPDICEAIVGAKHEIGHHGWTHTPPAQLSAAKEAEDLERGNEAIRQLCGKHANGYRSPSWDLSPNTIKLLLQQGFVYDSSMMGNDHFPYWARVGDVIHKDQPVAFGQPSELHEMPISWTLDDYPYFEFVREKSGILPGLAAAKGVLENWLNDFSYMAATEDWGVLTYTFHPFVIGRGHRMIILEKLIKELSTKGAEFMTLDETAREFIKRDE